MARFRYQIGDGAYGDQFDQATARLRELRERAVAAADALTEEAIAGLAQFANDQLRPPAPSPAPASPAPSPQQAAITRAGRLLVEIEEET